MKSVAMVLGLLPLAASAATITVNSSADTLTAADGRCTLREAIANVNAAADTTFGDCTAGTGGGDTITFGLPLPATIRRSATLGELTLQRDVTITGSANATLRIDGAGKTRVFEIASGTTSMSDVRIQRGTADHGGGFLVNSGASLILTNCTLSGNKATAGGGGIYNDGGTVTLSACTVSGNTANSGSGDGRGGGMYNASGTATLSACTLRRNRARGHGGDQPGGGQGYGGGIYNTGTLNVVDGMFSGNAAVGTTSNNLAGGGGLYNGGTADFTDSTFSRNTTKNYGGGLFNTGTLKLTACTLTGNRAGAGGALALNGGAVSLGNCTVSANRSRYSGGGLTLFDGTATLTSCTVSGNHTAGFAGGISGADQATLTNTVIANNTSGDGNNCRNTPVNGGHNLEDDSTCGFNGAGCASSSGSSFCNTNPRLDPAGLKDNGGPTQTIALCTGLGMPARCTGASPAIEAGDDAVTGPPDNLTTDQRGLPRLSGSHVDIGAYEVQQ